MPLAGCESHEDGQSVVDSRAKYEMADGSPDLSRTRNATSHKIVVLQESLLHVTESNRMRELVQGTFDR